VLYAAGQPREAVPLVRVVFEHALYLQALIRQGESAVDAAIREGVRQRRNFVETGIGGPAFVNRVIEEDQADVPSPIPDAAWTQQVITICDRLGLKNTIYLLYRLLCRYSHPTISSSLQFLSAPDEIDLGIEREPAFNLDSDMLFWTAVMMIWSIQIFNTLLAQPLLSDELRLAEKELGVVPIDQFPTSSNFGAMNVSSERLEQLIFGGSEGA
jgi:Family of unknown function (DUF5677)